MEFRIVVVTSLLLLVTHGSSAANRSHIIIILADDLGWDDVGFHGSDQVQTPNIDALAYNGVILNQHYVLPTCTPSRAALLTGRYPSNMGMQGVPIAGAESRGLPPATLLPQHLKDLGYSTNMIGKWHLGFYKKEFLPTHRGFDSFLGYLNGVIGYYNHIYQDLIPAKTIKDVFAEDSNGKSPAFNFGNNQVSGLDFFRNETPAWDLTGRYATDVFTEEAERVISTHDPDTPLFLYVSHLCCHGGNRGSLLEAPQDAVARFRYIMEPNRQTYAAMVWKLDESVGRVVAALQARDMLQDSVILFLTDNGAATVPVGVWPNWGSNYPLRGLKLTQWEGGVRGVGALWSAGLGCPRVSSQLVHVSDWLPTLYHAAGGDPTGLGQLDGVDQWEALLNDSPSQRQDALISVDEVRKIWAVRSGRWKLLAGSNHDGGLDGYYGQIGQSPDSPAYNETAVLESAVNKALGAGISRATLRHLRAAATVQCPAQANATACDLAKNPGPCLFDLHADPCETNDLYATHPEEVGRLSQLFKDSTANLVPQLNTAYDVAHGNPALYGNVWQPWADSCDENCKAV